MLRSSPSLPGVDSCPSLSQEACEIFPPGRGDRGHRRGDSGTGEDAGTCPGLGGQAFPSAPAFGGESPTREAYSGPRPVGQCTALTRPRSGAELPKGSGEASSTSLR